MVWSPREPQFLAIKEEPGFDMRAQFTGREDNDGAQLYEGDIVLYKNILEQDIICRVEYSDTLAGYCLTDDHGLYKGHLFDILSKYKVSRIGNYLKNPELLGDSDERD